MKDSPHFPYTERLLELPRFASDGSVAIKPGFDRIEALLDVMGRPEKGYRIALVAGTNGKGSTCSMMAACLTAAGYKTGLHTSPHLVHVKERMRVDGFPPSSEWLEKATARYFDSFIEVGASFFEATLALSLLWFADQGVSHAVVEVGLGGRLDATNTLAADISVITGVALDHTDLLGKTLALIAKEKAGIIKANKPVVVGDLPSSAKAKVETIASQRNASFLVAAEMVQHKKGTNLEVVFSTPMHQVGPLKLDLLGVHQVRNAAVALCALEAWVGPLSPDHARNGLEHVAQLAGLRGRCEKLSDHPLLVVDVAHNPDAVGASLTAFSGHLEDANASRSPFSSAHPPATVAQPTVIIGMLSDKDTESVAHILTKAQVDVWTVPTHGFRGLGAENLAQTMKKAGVKQVSALPNVPEAVKKARLENRNCLVLGSHLIVSEVLEWTESDKNFIKS